MPTQQQLEEKLASLIDKHGVPGAQLAVLDGGTITEVAAGVLSLRTGWPATPDACPASRPSPDPSRRSSS